MEQRQSYEEKKQSFVRRSKVSMRWKPNFDEMERTRRKEKGRKKAEVRNREDDFSRYKLDKD